MTLPFRSIVVPAPLTQWWQRKAAHERRILAFVAGVALAGVLWAFAWQPLARELSEMRATRPQRIATVAEARQMAEEMAGLARMAPPAISSDARGALERMLAQQGLRASVAEMSWQEGRARVVFGAIGFAALVNLLETLQREAGLRLIEGTLTARVEPGTVRAELTLAR